MIQPDSNTEKNVEYKKLNRYIKSDRIFCSYIDSDIIIWIEKKQKLMVRELQLDMLQRLIKKSWIEFDNF